MKLAILNDTHAGARNSSEIFIDYQRRFYEEVFFPYLIENDIQHIIHLGDYYEHRKFVNFKALNANRKHFLERLRDLGISMDIIPGNHDVVYKNTNELCSLKELLGHFTSNINIIMEPKDMDYNGFKLALIPWINSSNYASVMKFLSKSKSSWVGGHFELAGFEMMKGVTNAHGMGTKMFDRFEKVISGHFHTKSTQNNITYLGSQMEFNWSDCEDSKYFHIIDTDTREMTAVKNPITLFKKLVYNDEKVDYNREYDISNLNEKFVKIVVVKKKDPYAFDKFVDKIQANCTTHELKIAESFNGFSGENVNIDLEVSVEDTKELLIEYIDSVDAPENINKDKLKEMMTAVYIEAMNEDVV